MDKTTVASDRPLEGRRTVEFHSERLIDKAIDKGHASDFGVAGQKNDETKTQFKKTISDHVTSPTTTKIEGTYSDGRQPAIHYLDKKTRLCATTSADGEYWTAFKLDPRQYDHVIRRGDLR